MENTLKFEESVRLINEYKASTGKTQTVIASELDISSGALSSFLSGTYKTPHTIIPKIEQMLRIQKKKNVVPKEPAFQMTSISTEVMNTIEYCHLRGKVGVVYGDAGIGKTESIKEYKRKNSLAIVITVSPSFASMSGVNELLSEELGIRERVSRRIYKESVSKLKGSGRVIIVDEAQHLTSKTLDHIRCMCDESGIGCVFVGNEEVYARLKGSGKAEFAQLFSRIGMRSPVFVNNIQKKDIEIVFHEVDLEVDALELLFKIAHTHYGLRGAVNVFVNTAAVFGEISSNGIATMAKRMNIG